ncbi:MAG: hypothetical protein WC947_00660 [Elusimicrobiota bacterium]
MLKKATNGSPCGAKSASGGQRFFILTLSLFLGICGFVFSASPIMINEVAPAEAAGAEWIEFYVAVAGNYSNLVLQEGSAIIQGSTWVVAGTGATVANKTFPNLFTTAGVGDYILLHFGVKGTSNSEDDISGKGANNVWDFYTADPSLVNTDAVLTLRNAANTPDAIDAMAFANQDATWTTANNTALNNAVAEFQWTGSGQADCVASGSIAVGKSFGRDSSSTDTDDTGTAKSDWSIQPSTSPGAVNTGGAGGGTGSIKAVITEIDAGQSSSGDYDAVELYVIESTANIGGCAIAVSNSGTFTFPSVAVSSGDYIIAHFKSGTNAAVPIINAFGNRQWDFFSAITIVATENTLTLKNAAGTMIDFVPFAKVDGQFDYDVEYDAAVVLNQWVPAATSVSEHEVNSVDNTAGLMDTKITLNRRTSEYGVPVDTTNAKSDWLGYADRNLGRLVSSATASGGTGSITGKITEVAPGISGGDFIEIFVTAASADVSSVKIYEGTTLIKTFPGDMGTIAKDKFIVLWASKGNSATGIRGETRDETAADENASGYIDLFSDETSPGLTGTDNNISLKNADDTIVDFMSFANSDTSYTGATAAYDAAFTAGKWSPEATDEAGYIAGSFAWSGSTSKSMYRLATTATLAPMDTDTKADWSESSTTPGYGDYGGTLITTTKTMEVFQSPFSPYKDGTYSQAKIAYLVPANSQITMRVFDVSGHQVRILLDHSDGGGAAATVTWDGKDDDGNIVRTGIYIVNIESLDKTTGAAKTSSKRIVVGRKM